MTLQKRALFTAVAGVALGASATSYAAQNKTWNAPGTAANWNLSLTNWLTDSNAAASFATGDYAVFGANGAKTISITQSGGLSAGSLVINGAGYTIGGERLTISSGGTVSASSSATINSPVTAGGTAWSVDAGQMLTVNGALTGSTAMTKSGAGVLSLTGANSTGFTGSWNVNDGELRVKTPANLNGTVLATSMVFGGTGTGTIHFTDAYTYTESGQESGVSPKGVVLNQSGTFQVDQVVGFRGGFTGTGSLTKTGAGRFIIDGTGNTYSGVTNVNEGNLQLNGTLTATPSITVASGAILSGVGSATNSAVIVNGTLSPGKVTEAGSSKTLSTGAQTWSNGGEYAVTLTNVAGGTGSQTGRGISDLVTMTSLSAISGFTIDLGSTAPTNFNANSGTYEWLIAAVTSGSITGPVTSLDVDYGFSIGPNGGFSVFTIDNTSGTDYLGVRYAYNAVPEATTLLLGLVGMTPLAMHRRRPKA